MSYLPDVYKHFNQDHPDVAKLFDELAWAYEVIAAAAAQEPV